MPIPDQPLTPGTPAGPAEAAGQAESAAGTNPAAAALASLAVGTRVVVRHRIDGGFTDALGELVGLTDAEATIRTRRGDAVVRLKAIVAAKPVPPAPARRHTVSGK
ncbi:hypothetical protein [Sinomonas albida]|uniref:putative acetyltransferase n=1 Tax=Sinomonas albida TaxID=369942 RepID=UPI0030170AD8